MDANYVTNKAVSLLKQLHGIVFITKEFGGACRDERPDALLFNSGGTFLVETKITRQDFLNDKKKPFRADPEQDVGKYRYYACPEGLISPEELPEKWGLIYVRPKNQRALMPVGHGGMIKVGEEKHPIHGKLSKDIVSIWNTRDLALPGGVTHCAIAYDERPLVIVPAPCEVVAEAFEEAGVDR